MQGAWFGRREQKEDCIRKISRADVVQSVPDKRPSVDCHRSAEDFIISLVPSNRAGTSHQRIQKYIYIFLLM